MRNWAGQYPKIPEHKGQQILNSPKIMADCSRVRRRIRAMKTAGENQPPGHFRLQEVMEKQMTLGEVEEENRQL